MGRSSAWLNGQRPAIIIILNQIEINALRALDTHSRRDLTLLFETLRFIVTRRKNGEPRSEKAMRQAWFRWKTKSQQGATPSIADLALITEFAENNGLLRGLRDKDSLEIIEKLKFLLEDKRIKIKAITESTWRAKARLTVEDLFDFLEVRISNHYLGRNHSKSPISRPDSTFVQQEIGEMIDKLVTGILAEIYTNRMILDSLNLEESIYQPFEGWPSWMDRLKDKMSLSIANEAKRCSLNDQAYLAPRFGELSSQGQFRGRIKMLPEYEDDQTTLPGPPAPDFGDDDDWASGIHL